MKTALMFPAAIGLLFLGGCAEPSQGAGHAVPKVAAAVPIVVAKPGEHLQVRTTAYTQSEAGGNKNGVGGRLRFGGNVYSAASDWSWMPLGTRFRVGATGSTYVIEDYGSALVGRRTIDLFMPTRRQMNAWGTRTVDIEILEWGSKIMSLKLLEGRQRNLHVRKMVDALHTQGHR